MCSTPTARARPADASAYVPLWIRPLTSVWRKRSTLAPAPGQRAGGHVLRPHRHSPPIPELEYHPQVVVEPLVDARAQPTGAKLELAHGRLSVGPGQLGGHALFVGGARLVHGRGH